MLWTQISPQCSWTSYYNSTPSWNILNFLVWFLFLFVTDYVNWNLRLKMTLFEKVWISRLAEIFFLQQVRELYNLYSSVFLNTENHNKVLISPHMISYYLSKVLIFHKKKITGYLARVLCSFGSFQVCDVNKIIDHHHWWEYCQTVTF